MNQMLKSKSFFKIKWPHLNIRSYLSGLNAFNILIIFSRPLNEKLEYRNHSWFPKLYNRTYPSKTSRSSSRRAQTHWKASEWQSFGSQRRERWVYSAKYQQDCGNSCVIAMELPQSCTKPRDSWRSLQHYHTPHNKVKGVYWIHPVRLSVCPLTFRVCPVASTVQDGFFPYLVQMINSMRGCVACDDTWPWPISSRSQKIMSAL